MPTASVPRPLAEPLVPITEYVSVGLITHSNRGGPRSLEEIAEIEHTRPYAPHHTGPDQRCGMCRDHLAGTARHHQQWCAMYCPMPDPGTT